MIEGEWRREEARTRREGETGLWGGRRKRKTDIGKRDERGGIAFRVRARNSFSSCE